MKRWLFIQMGLFQLLWLGAVLGQNQALIVLVILLSLHFYLSPNRAADLRILPLGLVGFGLDLTLMSLGVFQFAEFPLWLLFLWFGFALSLGNSLAWVKQLPLLATIPLGAVMGALSYVAGYKLEVVAFPLGELATFVLLIAIWGVVFPAGLRVDTAVRRGLC